MQWLGKINDHYDHHDMSQLMKRDFVSRMERAQTSPNSRLDTCMNEGTASIRVVTDVVLATTPLMPKSE